MTKDVEGRVGDVEKQLAVHGEQLRHVTAVTDETSKGVKILLERDAARPQQQSVRSVLATLASAGAILCGLAAFTWWMISVSPVVQDHEKRLTKLDEPGDGIVQELRDDVRELKSWQPRIVKN